MTKPFLPSQYPSNKFSADSTIYYSCLNHFWFIILFSFQPRRQLISIAVAYSQLTFRNETDQDSAKYTCKEWYARGKRSQSAVMSWGQRLRKSRGLQPFLHRQQCHQSVRIAQWQGDIALIRWRPHLLDLRATGLFMLLMHKEGE